MLIIVILLDCKIFILKVIVLHKLDQYNNSFQQFNIIIIILITIFKQNIKAFKVQKF